MAGHITSTSETARKVLHDIAESKEEKDKYSKSNEPAGPFVELAYHRQMFIELLLVRHVDNYFNYLSSLLFEIFTQRPESMKSGEKVDVELVLEHKSMESLTRGLAERKVDALSYSSFATLLSFFKERFSLSICADEHVDAVNEYIETRNIIVHNRGIINRRYLEKIGQTHRKMGQLRLLDITDLDAIVPTFFSTVKSLDQQARSHMKIRGHYFDIPAIVHKEYEQAKERYRDALGKTPN